MFWEYLQKIEVGLSNWLSIYPEYIILITGAYFSIFSTIFYLLVIDYSKVITDNFQISIVILGIGLLLLSGVSLYLSYSHKKKLLDYQAEIETLQSQINELMGEDVYHQDVILDIVRLINRYIGDCMLGFEGQKTKTDRISLYVHDMDGFFPIARYSINPTFNRIRRKKYPLDQGAIRHAFDNGTCFRRYPDPNTEPDKYYNMLEEIDHIPRAVAEQFSMKSRLIFGYRIGDNDDPVAVFIVESLKPNRFSKIGLEAAFQSVEVRVCMDIILRLELPNPNIGDEWEEEETGEQVNHE